MAEIRPLTPDDQRPLERFLLAHPNTTMFLRSNLLAAGLVDHGERQEGTYVAAFDGSQVLAVVAHYWNGNLVVEAPVELEALVHAAVRASGREVRGFIGPHAQAVAARACTGIDLR